MATELSWPNYLTNYSLTETTAQGQAKEMMFMIKAFMCGQVGVGTSAPWVVYGSSDGTTAGLDGNDRWGATYNASKINFKNGGTCSWVVLESPFTETGGGKVYVMIGLTKAGFNPADWWRSFEMWSSKTAPTGGTTSSVPIITNYTYHGDGGADGRRGGVLMTTDFAPRKMQAVRSSDGQIHITSSRSGEGKSTFHLMFRKAVAAGTENLFRINTTHCDFTGFAGSSDRLYQATGGDNSFVQYPRFNVIYYSGVQGFQSSVHGSASMGLVAYGSNLQNGAFVAGVRPAIPSKDSYDTYIFKNPNDSGLYSKAPIVFNSSDGEPGGYIPDLNWAPVVATLPDFSTTPATGQADFYNVGCVFLPCPVGSPIA